MFQHCLSFLQDVATTQFTKIMQILLKDSFVVKLLILQNRLLIFSVTSVIPLAIGFFMTTREMLM